ncbi:MAG TPA: DUF5946 family protein [Anaerolineales bacterium]|nr:DUF5946 family protein [Anaerolineales bacterium]
MLPESSCPECNSPLQDGLTCQDHFHTLLFWENEVPEYGEVHHLTVLCYHLQHPSLYSPEGLIGARQLLTDFLVLGLSPSQVVRRDREIRDSGKRQSRITSRLGQAGSYPVPVKWTMTAADVVAAGKENYIPTVPSWAFTVKQALDEVPPFRETQ